MFIYSHRARFCQDPDIPQQGQGRAEMSHPVIKLPTDQQPPCSVAAIPQGLGVGGSPRNALRDQGPRALCSDWLQTTAPGKLQALICHLSNTTQLPPPDLKFGPNRLLS